MTKANAKRRRRNRAAEAKPRSPVDITVVTLVSNRPTDERRRRGIWKDPKGQGKDDRPSLDLAHDMIGRLCEEGHITHDQEQAARTWQELRAAYVAELDVKAYRSCLDIGAGGYDATDGNPNVVRAYRRVTHALGPVRVSVLMTECDKPGHAAPGDLRWLKKALDRLREIG